MQTVDLSKKNNFDIRRLVASVFVIITHSYALSGKGESDYLSTLTFGTLSFSHAGVAIFFVISGYLILQSVMKTDSILSYFWKRTLRIFPGLLVVLLLCVFILGPIVTSLSISDYFSSSSSYKHLYSATIYNISHLSLQGVFETNPNQAVNGSLWTLQYEFTCYNFIALIIFFFKSIDKIKPYLIVCLYVLIISFRIYLGERYFWFNYSSSFLAGMNIMYLYEWMIYFMSGMILYLFGMKYNCMFLTLGIILSLYTILLFFDQINFARITIYFLIPLIVFVIAFKVPQISELSKYGDISYGMYIYAYPIQQLILHYNHKITIELFVVLSILFTIPFAMLSWHFIEKKSLKFKTVLSKRNLVNE
jgi:peptidoglycan/LPS O-acetylase OafA/YrhL